MKLLSRLESNNNGIWLRDGVIGIALGGKFNGTLSKACRFLIIE